MDCDAFRAWIDRAGPVAPDRLPSPVRTHQEMCPACHALLQEEGLWQRLFATVPTPPLMRSVWPDVLREIHAHQLPVPSLSAELMAIGRLLVPALALLVLCLGGVAMWGVAETGDVRIASSVVATDSTTELTFLRQDPDTTLHQWVGISER